MALAANLIPGYSYRVEGGLNEGEVVTIVSNITFPDSDLDRRRKVAVTMPNGDLEYILPRMLSNRPVPGQSAVPAPVAPVPVGIDPTTGAFTPSITPDSTATFSRDDEGEPFITVTTPAKPVQPLLVDVASIPLDEITDPMDPRLDPFRPSAAKCKRYKNRIMENGMTDVDFLLTFTNDDYRAENQGRPANIALKGDTQSGKTFLVEVLAVEWAKRLGYHKPMPVFTLSGSTGVTDYDLFGQTTSYTDPVTGIERLVWLPGIVDLAARVGGILYGDEANAMPERVVSSLHPLADHRHLFVNRNKPVFKDGQYMPELVIGHLDLWFIITYNEGYRGMGDIGAAFNNRFRSLRWGYDEAVEKQLITSPTVRLLGEGLRLARDDNKIRTPVGTAALQRLERDIKHFGIPMALTTFTGMFGPNDLKDAQDVIKDRSIKDLLEQEAEQAVANANPDPHDLRMP